MQSCECNDNDECNQNNPEQHSHHWLKSKWWHMTLITRSGMRPQTGLVWAACLHYSVDAWTLVGTCDLYVHIVDHVVCIQSCTLCCVQMLKLHAFTPGANWVYYLNQMTWLLTLSFNLPDYFLTFIYNQWFPPLIPISFNVIVSFLLLLLLVVQLLNVTVTSPFTAPAFVPLMSLL